MLLLLLLLHFQHVDSGFKVTVKMQLNAVNIYESAYIFLVILLAKRVRSLTCMNLIKNCIGTFTSLQLISLEESW